MIPTGIAPAARSRRTASASARGRRAEAPRAHGRDLPGYGDVVLDRDRDPGERAVRRRRVVGLGERLIGERRPEGVQARIERLDPAQVELDQLARRHLARADQLGERLRSGERELRRRRWRSRERRARARGSRPDSGTPSPPCLPSNSSSVCSTPSLSSSCANACAPRSRIPLVAAPGIEVDPAHARAARRRARAPCGPGRSASHRCQISSISRPVAISNGSSACPGRSRIGRVAARASRSISSGAPNRSKSKWSAARQALVNTSHEPSK